MKLRFSLIAFFAACLAVTPIKADPKTEGNAAPAPSLAGNSALVEHFQRAFDEGFIIGPKRTQEAEKHLAQARRLAPRDPRVDYAFGLVLVKQSRLKQAITQFEAAIEMDQNYWPAWQAAIWAQIVDKRFEPGLSQLVSFAQLVHDFAPADEVSEVQRETARWIGQVFAALSSADDATRHDKLLTARADDVLKALGADLWEALEEGRDALNEREFARGQVAGQARQAGEKADRARKERKAALLDKDLEGAAKAKENNEKTKEEWKTWLEDELAKSDKELGRLEKDFKFLDQRAQSLNQSMILAGQEITAMELALSTMNPGKTNPVAMQNAQQQYFQRQNQMLAYQLDYNTTVGRMSEVAQAGSLVSGKRAEVIARYEKATGDLSKKNTGLDKWSDRLKNEKQKVVVNKPAKKAKGAAADKKTDKKPAPATFKMILPLDLAHEKERLLASLSPPPKPVKAKGDAGDQ